MFSLSFEEVPHLLGFIPRKSEIVCVGPATCGTEWAEPRLIHAARDARVLAERRVLALVKGVLVAHLDDLLVLLGVGQIVQLRRGQDLFEHAVRKGLGPDGPPALASHTMALQLVLGGLFRPELRRHEVSGVRGDLLCLVEVWILHLQLNWRWRGWCAT